MAITIFNIPPMSASPERAFLGVKHTIIPERVKLRAKILEIVKLLKS